METLSPGPQLPIKEVRIIRRLTSEERKVARHIEHIFATEQVVPSLAQLEAEFPTINIPALFQEDPFREALHRKYLLGQYENREQGLTEKQLLLISMLSNPADTRKLKLKLDEAKITAEQYRHWLLDRNFTAALRRQVEHIFAERTPEVLMSLADSAASGELQAQKLYLELTGRYTPQSKVTVQTDINQVLEMAVEAIQRHVHDAQVLTAIAEDFDKIMRGEVLGELTPSNPVVEVQAHSNDIEGAVGAERSEARRTPVAEIGPSREETFVKSRLDI